MSVLTVRNHAQSVFPDGLQDSMILRNDGPFTVYVDNDTTVNASSHSIPPTGVMAWDSARPLFLSLDPSLDDNASSSLTIVRNSQPAVFNNAIDSVLWVGQVTGPGILTAETDLVEVTAFDTLVVQMHSDSPGLQYTHLTPDPFLSEKTYQVGVAWLDDAGNIIGVDQATVPCEAIDEPAIEFYSAIFASINNATGSRVTFPVRGSYCKIRVRTLASTSDLAMTLTIIGTTRSLTRGMYFTKYQTYPYCATILNAGVELMSDGFTVDLGGTFALAALRPVVLSGLGGVLDVRVISPTAITTAGVLNFASSLNLLYHHAPAIPIPVSAAFASITATIAIPLYVPTSMYFSVVPLVGGGMSPANLYVTVSSRYVDR